MTAPKLPMPGVRDRATTGKGAGAGAGAGRGGVPPLPQVQQQQHRQNNVGNGYAGAVGAEEQQQGRCSNSSRVGGEGQGQARLGPSIMQPLPLASRYADASASKHDSLRHTPATALGSSWIRRFLPPTGELVQEAKATRLPTKAVLGGGAIGRGGDSGSQPPGPLLLASGPNEHKEQQLEAGGMASKGWMGHESCRETSVKVAGNGESMQKGKAPVEKESRHQDTTAALRDVDDNVRRGGSLRKVNSNPSLHPGTQSYVLEESSKQQQPQGNHRIALSTRGESHVNGTSGAVTTGFGSWVVVKAPSKVGGGTFSKLKGTEAKTRIEADVPSAVAADRAKHVGIQTISAQTGTMFTPRVVEDPWSGRPRAVEFASAWGFPRSSKKPEAELDGGRPPMVQPDGARETVGVSGLKGAEPAARFNPFREGYYQYRLDSMHRKGVDHEGGVEKMKPGSSKFSERFVPSYLPANLGRKEDIGQGTENRLHSHAAEDASPRPNFGAVFPENRKMKEIMGSSGRHTDTGPPEQQHYQDFRPYASPFQGDMFVGKVGHPLPFSPHSSFPGEDNSGEDTSNSRGRPDRPKSPLTTVFGAPKPYEDGLDGRAAQAEQQAPLTSLYAAFEGKKHPEPAISSSQTPSLPADVRSRLQDGPTPANRPFEGPQVNGDQDDPSGANDANLSSSQGARSRFDNQSSHFSNSPWPDEDSNVPNDEAGSRPTGSGYHSQASRVANRSEGESKGKNTSAYRYDTGGPREGFGTPERNRESSGGGELDRRKYPRSHGEDEGKQMYPDQGKQMSNRDNQAHLSPKPLEHFTRQAISGYKDDTSNSSPPSYPAGYNSSETGSPVLPRGIVDEHLLSIAGKLRKVEFDSELDGSRVPRIQKGSRKEMTGFAKRPMEHLNSSKRDSDALYRDKDVSAFLSNDPDLQRAQPTARDVDREGIRQGKLRMSGEAMGEGGISGPSKRTRHHGDGGSNFGSELAGSRTPSSWLKRWLPPSTGNAAKPPTGFARPKENPRNGMTSEPPRTNGNTNVIGFSNDRNTEAQRARTDRGQGIDRSYATKSRNGMRDIAATRGHNGLPSHPTPSAAAMALVGIAARKIGPFSQQRRGSVAMWPPVHLQTVQAPEVQQPSGSDLSR